MTTALLIIDVQHALCGGHYAAFEFERVIERINSVSSRARLAKWPVVVIQHESQGGALDYNSRGWQLASGLQTHLLIFTFERRRPTHSTIRIFRPSFTPEG